MTKMYSFYLDKTEKLPIFAPTNKRNVKPNNKRTNNINTKKYASKKSTIEKDVAQRPVHPAAGCGRGDERACV